MHTKRVRTEKREGPADIGPETFIERLKKARALNCNPAYLGISTYICNKVFNRTHASTKFQ
jgi:hypothetical protein